MKVQTNDVSFLFPLGDGLLTPDDLGRGGALLTADVYGKERARRAREGIPAWSGAGSAGVDAPRPVLLRPRSRSRRPVCENQPASSSSRPARTRRARTLCDPREELTSAVRAILACAATLTRAARRAPAREEGRFGGPTYAALKAIIPANAGKANLVRFTPCPRARLVCVELPRLRREGRRSRRRSDPGAPGRQ